MIDMEQARDGFAWPDRYWLIALGGFVLIVLLWIGAASDILRARRLTLADDDRELSSLASALAEQTARSLQGVEFLLDRTAGWTPEPERGQTWPENARTFYLRQQIDGVPQIRQLDILDAAGNRVATTLAAPKRINVAGRPYFQQLQRVSGNALVIGEPFASLDDGRPTFPVARRLEDEQGQFRGVVRALVEDEYFRKFYKQIDLGAGTSIRLLRTDGTPVVVFENRPAERPSTHICLVQRPVPGFPLKVEVTRDEAVALATWRTSTIDELIGAAALSLFVVVLAFALIRQVRCLGQVNRRLKSSEQRWRAVFVDAPAGIMLVRPHGYYLAVNPAFQRMVGYSAAELTKLKPIDITHPDDIELSLRHIDQLARGEHDSVRFEKRYLHRDGHVVWTQVSGARVTVSAQPSDRMAAQLEDVFVATVEDVTQRREDEQARRQLESQLRQSQKLEALGTFAGGIAHDFNNILGAILGYGERALHALAEGTPQRRHVERVLNAGDRARSLVERILTFSRSGMTIRVPVHLQPVVTETIVLLKVRLPDAIRLEVQLDARDAFVAADPAHMHQVVMNLCSNAVLAMPNGGTLRVELALQRLEAPRSLSHGAVGAGEFVRLTVHDTGVGMPPDLLERIFNPFFTTRKAGQGTGLGLALVDGIVREYSGGVDVHSVVGEGTRFDVYLPVIDAAAASPDRPRAALPHGDGQTVLLVDDEEALVALGEEVLAELGYAPIGFASSEAAWQAFDAKPERFDAVFTDQTMPDMTGIELASRIRAVRPDIPIILYSGYGSAALERDAKATGIRDVLRKPLRQADIALALSRVLSRQDSETA